MNLSRITLKNFSLFLHSEHDFFHIHVYTNLDITFFIGIGRALRVILINCARGVQSRWDFSRLISAVRRKLKFLNGIPGILNRTSGCFILLSTPNPVILCPIACGKSCFCLPFLNQIHRNLYISCIIDMQKEPYPVIPGGLSCKIPFAKNTAGRK